MTQNLSDQKTQNSGDQKMCNICHQRFNSDAELQEHQKSAHAQQKRVGNEQSSEHNYKDQSGQQKKEKIA
jgi:hypothetical protein